MIFILYSVELWTSRVGSNYFLVDIILLEGQILQRRLNEPTFMVLFLCLDTEDDNLDLLKYVFR